MRLYLTATGRYAGTQDDAKADGKGWVLEEVPTDKAGLIAYLNDLKDGTAVATAYALPDGFAPVVSNADFVPPAGVKAVDVAMPKAQEIWTASEITDFILDRADVNQVANILSCIGTRFGELVKERR